MPMIFDFIFVFYLFFTYEKQQSWDLKKRKKNKKLWEGSLNFNGSWTFVSPELYGGWNHSSVQFSSVTQSNPWTAAHQAFLSITNSESLLKLMSIASVMPSNHLILCCPLLLSPSICPSIRVFSSESILHWLELHCWSFSFTNSPSNEYSGLTSFRMDWLDLLAVQGTLKSLLQHHNSKASILLCSAFFIVQFSHSYMTSGKTITLTRWTFTGKVILCFLICYLGWSKLFFQGASIF